MVTVKAHRCHILHKISFDSLIAMDATDVLAATTKAPGVQHTGGFRL
jgi:hypothetical protein